ncbi:unnamed protein product [Haemonchus placei]|uniref:Uncharacterized protein n=1 Tax=Haemonchus placei TaxID=6290 RepID=A0A3P8A8X1_HAEPC|nr:unnamed protein product [Haemonchus placei]
MNSFHPNIAVQFFGVETDMYREEVVCVTIGHTELQGPSRISAVNNWHCPNKLITAFLIIVGALAFRDYRNRSSRQWNCDDNIFQ